MLSVPVDSDWADSDWADDRADRKSCSGGALLYYGVPVLTWSRTQASRAQSNAEGEHYALGTGATEALGLASLLGEWSGSPDAPSSPFCCQTAAARLRSAGAVGQGA